MAISEQSRHRMHQRLHEVLGPEEAATLMEHLPPVGWADVATKRDLDATRASLERDLDATRASLERDITAARTELGHDLTAARTELGHDIAALEQRLLVRFEASHARMQRDLRVQAFGLVAALTALWTAFTAAAQVL